MKAYDTVETVMNVLGVGVGVTMIKDILGVALLVINILLLIIRVVVFVVRWLHVFRKCVVRVSNVWLGFQMCGSID